QVDRRTQGDRKPAELGYTLSVTGGASRARLSWSALYTRVDNLDYRTPANEEQYTIRGVGLARSHDDYDQLTLRAATSPAPRTMLTGELTYLRQGEGSIAKRFPPINLLADSLRFLTGTVERTLRLAVQGTWTPVYGVNLSADLGRHFIGNAGHVSGRSDGRGVWRVRAEIRRRLTGAFRW
ncbi:MAG: hypothetical protein Q8Q85_04345, partial [Gemmatimonadales bacterium]|nr:hypothetical protein [Gemmatimonadales bacterium]